MLCVCAVDDVIESGIIKNRNVTRDFLDRRPLLKFGWRFLVWVCFSFFVRTKKKSTTGDSDVDGSSVSQSRTASRGTAVEDLSVRAREISLV